MGSKTFTFLLFISYIFYFSYHMYELATKNSFQKLIKETSRQYKIYKLSLRSDFSVFNAEAVKHYQICKYVTIGSIVFNLTKDILFVLSIFLFADVAMYIICFTEIMEIVIGMTYSKNKKECCVIPKYVPYNCLYIFVYAIFILFCLKLILVY